VVVVPGLARDKVVEAEWGGTTQVEQAQNLVMAERVEKMLGMNDAMRGAVTGVGTATENQLAASASSARVGFVQRQFEEATLQLLKTWAWYLHEDDRVIFNLGPEAAKALGEPGPYIFFGGHPSKERTARIKAFFKREYPEEPVPPPALLKSKRSSFDNLELEIELYSMERTNEATQLQRAMTAFEIAQAAGQGAVAMPHIDEARLLQIVGDALNMPDLAQVLDKKLASILAEATLGMQMPPPPEEGGGGGEKRQQSRLARDVMPAAGFGGGRITRPPSAAGRLASMVPQGLTGRTLGGKPGQGAGGAGPKPPAKNGKP
jgi:hypothetical protein